MKRCEHGLAILKNNIKKKELWNNRHLNHIYEEREVRALAGRLEMLKDSNVERCRFVGSKKTTDCKGPVQK